MTIVSWQQIQNHTKEIGCNAFSGCGIKFYQNQKTSILRSVDGTPYYDDDMSDPDNIKYTLYGPNNNQNKKEKKFNEPLLTKSEHIFVYRKVQKGQYIWYGKYEIIDETSKLWPGKDGNMRIIIILLLKRI